jgi:hypothetical protein
MMLLKRDETPTIYADVDGSIVFWPDPSPGRAMMPGDKRTGGPRINQPMVDALKKFYVPGKTCLVIWSRGGAAHAKKMADFCGLTADAYLPKPRICIDDKAQTVTAGHVKGFTVLEPDEPEKVPVG